MAREIYPESVFKEQSNGQVFYKEGKLNDPLMGEPMEGIFQSWKYSWDSGKQVFKASDTEKVYEKRLIKDKYGNPHWSGWMEIVPGEANGIQAIAVNNQPLQLPNNDGAIKLQITPQMIDTYTRREIYDLVTSKIDQTYSSTYEYVNWIEGCKTALEVLKETYGQEGGEINKYYLVEPEPVSGKASKAKYYIWAPCKDGTYTWLEVDTPDMKSFVSYSAYNEHQFDKILHTSQEDRDRWDEKVTHAELDEAVKGSIESGDHALELVNEHIADVGEITSPHISAEERMRLNSLFQNVQDMPDNSSRYVVENGTYALAYEQTQQSKTKEEVVVKDLAQAAYADGDIIVTVDDGLRTQFNSITSENNVIEDFVVKFNNIAVMGENNKWYIETDTGYVSDVYSKSDTWVEIHPSFAVIPNTITLKMTNKTEGRISVNSIQVVIEKKAKLGVDIGDPAKKLTVNLVGPEDAVPTYNGIPLTELTVDASETAKWGKITGDINHQVDLDKKIANAISRKINYADLESHLRWDVYRDGVIKSVIQQVNNNEEVVEKIEVENKSYRKGETLIDDIKAKMQALRDQGYVMYTCRFVAENISVYQNEDKEPLPVYFKTNNNAIPASPTVVGAFVWDWPGTLFDEFDRITIEGNSAEYITNAYLEVKCIKYGDVEIGLFNEHDNEYYSVAIKADELANEVNNFISKSKENATILAEKVAKIAGDEKTVIGARDYNYDDEKETGTIEVYGQEIDERYANRAKFEETAEMAERHETDIAAIHNDIGRIDQEREQDLEDFKNYKELHDAEMKETAEKINQAVEEAIETCKELTDDVKEEAKKVQENLDAEAVTRAATDEELSEEINQNKENIEKINESLDDYLKIADYHRAEIDQETFDLVIENSEDFDKYVLNGEFENAERVLFKKGTYVLDDQAAKTKQVDFSKIKYVKGEMPCVIKCDTDGQASPYNYDKTAFRDIEISWGFAISPLKIDPLGRRVKKVEVSGNTVVELLPEYEVYDIDVNSDTEITFASPIDGKEYVFYFNQPMDKANKVAISNFFENNDNETIDGLDHQAPGMKTMVRAICDQGTTTDGFILTEVIYELVGSELGDQLINVVVGDIKTQLYESTEKVDSVAVRKGSSVLKEGEVIAQVMRGNTFTVTADILEGFAHNEETGIDYVVKSEDGTIIGKGVCDKTETFKIPNSLKLKDDGTAPAVTVEFDLKPQLVSIVMNPTYEPYTAKSSYQGISAENNQTTFVQVKYGKTKIRFDMEKDWVAYGYADDYTHSSDIYQATLPWEFAPAEKKDHLNYTLVIKPLFYASFSNITLTNKSSLMHTNKNSTALIGSINEFDLEANVSEKVKADPNYGKLYTAAPISLVYPQAEPLYSGSVDYISNTDQELSVEFDNSCVGKIISVGFAWHQNNSVEKEIYVGSISSEETPVTCPDFVEKEGKTILCTYINQNKQYTLEADLSSSEIQDKSGVWSSSNNEILSISNAKDNTCTVACLKSGVVTVSYKNMFTGLVVSKKINVQTFAKSVGIAQPYSSVADKEISPELVFIDFNDKVVPASQVTDVSGEFDIGEAAEGYLNCEKNSIKITNKPFPEGENIMELPIYFRLDTNKDADFEGFKAQESADTITEEKECIIVVRPKEYKITYTVDPASDIEGHHIQGSESTLSLETGTTNCYASGGQMLTIVINMKDKTALSKANKEILTEAFDYKDLEIVRDEIGMFIAKTRMPYHEVTFELN